MTDIIFSCIECQFSINGPEEFLEHTLSTHRNSNSFMCGAKLDSNNFCSKTYRSYSTLRKHIKNKHKPIEQNIASTSSVIFLNQPQDSSNLNNNDDNNISIVSNEEEQIKNEDLSSVNDQEIDKNLNFENVCEVEGNDKNTKISELISINAQSSDHESQNDKYEPHVLFVAKLHSYPDISRARVQEIIRDVDELFQSSLNSIENSIVDKISSSTDNSSWQIVILMNFIATVFKKHREKFQNFTSEWRCFKEFEKLNTFIRPVHYDLGQREEYIHERQTQMLKMVRATAQFIPIRDVFKKFFEIPGHFQKTLDYVNFLTNDKTSISNIIQCSLWNDLRKKFEDKIVFPLFMNYDDYENNNPLGSHNGISKCGAVYLSIACLPPDMASKLKNIFLFILFNSLDRQVYNNPIVFSKAIDELNFLENHGIEINLPDKIIKIYFKLTLILGDNLGIHSILGFAEGFNATFFCRFCYTQRNEIQNIFDESSCVMRTIESYEADVLKNNLKETGISSSCVFHQIPDFHVMKNRIVDVMHDLLEGVCQYDLGALLYHFINVDKFITLAQLNNSVRAFNYGNRKNKPTEIMDSQINNQKLKMSSSEMLCFIRYLPLILGPLIPSNNEHWYLLLQLNQLIETLIQPHFDIHEHVVLREQILNYLRLLQKLFPNQFKPKHHFLIHYPSVLLASGPFWKFSAMRYEQKNQEGKKISKATVSRVNITRTIAIKHQLILNYRFLKSDIENNVTDIQEISLKSMPDIDHFKNLLPVCLINTEKVYKTAKVEFEGEEICVNSILMIPSDNGPKFVCVKEILLIDNDFGIIGQELVDVHFNEHLNGFKVFSMSYRWTFCQKNDLNGLYVTHMARVIGGDLYIVKCWS